jgi:DNA-binding response OmpR family regulator
MNLPKKRILVVEDEPAIRAMLRKRLEANGYEVMDAEDGEEGLTLARREKPDIILLDLMLPKRDGYSVCRLLKFDQRYRHIPVVMLTARAQDKDRRLGQQTGADAYVTKPFDATELLAVVTGLLKDK